MNEHVLEEKQITMKKQAVKKNRNTYLWGWLLIAPTAIGLIVLNIIPVFQTLLMSFQNVSTFGTSTFVGLDNYVKMFSDAEFWQSLRNTLVYTVIQVPLTVILSTIAAVLVNTKIKGVGIYRVIYFLPMIAAPAAVAMVWRWLYNSEFGLINTILGYFGLENVQWLSDPNVVLWSIIIVGIWSNIGYNMILLLAGLQEIPQEYYEAATVDGAGKIRQFFQITVPLLTPQLFFVLVTSVISALQIFDIIFIMFDVTNPSLNKAQSLVYMFFNESFVLNDKGYGSAVVMVLVVIIMCITAIQLIAQKKWVTYD
ncbi:carbohydrate ABC transporter membrane protein 1, CUT1 family [Desemzia incerta]|uniref:Carbohydrate ABC transporter membrane protein 1, CUT1 family n=1 Tax=Desemzia incerta TaxID=82801 RepID=A0A1I5X4G2_9LACT|nr:carbohydrate ABC transporter membrane protein 1, CUT1 family [Desemzia incerta]